MTGSSRRASTLNAGKVEVVALSLGHLGALLVTRDQALRAQALPIKPVSAVGAGDSFLGAMVFSLAKGDSLADAFRLGMAAGSAALINAGTELCQPADVDRLYAAGDNQNLFEESSLMRR